MYKYIYTYTHVPHAEPAGRACSRAAEDICAGGGFAQSGLHCRTKLTHVVLSCQIAKQYIYIYIYIYIYFYIYFFLYIYIY